MLSKNKSYIVINVGTQNSPVCMYLYFVSAKKIDRSDIVVLAISDDFLQKYRGALIAGDVPALPLEHTASIIADVLTKTAADRGRPALVRANSKDLPAELYALMATAGITAVDGAGDPGAMGGVLHYGFGMLAGNNGFHLARIIPADHPEKPIEQAMVRAAFRKGPLASGG